MKYSKHQEINDYIDSLTDLQKELVLKIRATVLSTDKKNQEGMKWGSIAFFNEQNICGFRVAKSHVTLVFMDGANLDNKKKILQGSGKKSRSLKTASVDEIPVDGIKGLVRQAIKMGM